MVKHFIKVFNGDYGVKLTPNKFRGLCEVDWHAFGAGWPPERLTDKIVVNEVYRVIVGKPGHPDQLPYIDCWKDAVLIQPTWLRPCLEQTCKIMVARVAALPSIVRNLHSGRMTLETTLAQVVFYFLKLSSILKAV
jgi:hypothetical protein